MTSYSSSVPQSTSETYLHPWYIALRRLGNTTTCVLESTQKQPTETTGVKPIKKCSRCKRWDAASNMYYDRRNAQFWHKECQQVTSKISKKTKGYLCDTVKIKQFRHPEIGKCPYCKGYDSKLNFYQSTKRVHPSCQCAESRNKNKMKPHKTDTCAFTGLPFGSKSEMKPVGDHDHDTLMYRGHIWSAANRLEGAAKFIMNEADWTVDELCDALKVYLAKPGIDIGLEPYPQLGYATPEEALANLSTNP